MGRETKLVHATVQYLEMRGAMVWRNNKGASRMKNKSGKERFVQFGGRPGASDVFAILPPHGTFLAVECKIDRGRATKDQLVFMQDVRDMGGHAVAIWNLDDLYEFLRNIPHSLLREAF